MIPRHTTSCVGSSIHILTHVTTTTTTTTTTTISLQLSSDILHPYNQEKKVIQDDIMTPEEKGKTTHSIS
jgi:hypothetical protein